MSAAPNNVVPLFGHALREAGRDQMDKAAAEKKAATDRLRAKSLRVRLLEKTMINKESDRIRVAKNLGRILNEMEAKGYKSEKLLRDLGMGKEGDSTKQLYNYVLPENAEAVPASARVRALTKAASLYVRLAERAATVMKADVELVVLRLFENTTYQVDDAVPDERIAPLDQIRELLVGIAEAAIRSTNLDTYRELLESDKIGWNVDGLFGDYPSIPIDIFFKDRMARHISYLGYAPTILLYQEAVGPPSSITGEAFQIHFDADPAAINKFYDERRPLPKKYRMPVRLSVRREIWFGLGPIETDRTWKPIFEKRYSLHIHGQKRERSLHISSYDPIIASQTPFGRWPPLGWLHWHTLFPRCPDGASLSISVGPHFDRTESIGFEDVQRERLEDRWLIELNKDSAVLFDDPDIHAGQFFYEVVDLESCVKYLDQLADPDDWDEFESECASVSLNRQLWPHDEDRESWYQRFPLNERPMMHAAAPVGSIARAIEQNVLCNDVDHRLDTVLFKTVRKRIRAAIEYHQKIVRSRDDRLAQLLNGWKTP
jgi:hypothetical protein